MTQVRITVKYETKQQPVEMNGLGRVLNEITFKECEIKWYIQKTWGERGCSWLAGNKTSTIVWTCATYGLKL